MMHFEIQCDQCDYRKMVSGAIQFAIREDGREVIVPNPSGSYIVSRATGKFHSQLEKEDRLRRRNGYVCLTCGEAGYYGKHGDTFEGMTDSDFEETMTDSKTAVYQVSYTCVFPQNVHRTPDLCCAACGGNSLEIAGGRSGCLASFAEAWWPERWRRWQIRRGLLPHCTRCHSGHIHWEYRYIS